MIKPHEVHPSHNVVDAGWFISDPECIYCKIGAFDNNGELLKYPCYPIPQQLELFNAQLPRL